MSSSEESIFQVREYRTADFPHLCAIDRLCFPEAIAYTPEEIALGLAQPGAFALVAEVRNEVIGFVLACRSKRSLGHIITIDVRAEFRWMGLGKTLMLLVEQRFRQSGVARIVLEVSVANAPAIRFYQGLGYVVKRLLPHYYADGSDGYLMEKSLSGNNGHSAGAVTE